MRSQKWDREHSFLVNEFHVFTTLWGIRAWGTNIGRKSCNSHFLQQCHLLWKQTEIISHTDKCHFWHFFRNYLPKGILEGAENYLLVANLLLWQNFAIKQFASVKTKYIYNKDQTKWMISLKFCCSILLTLYHWHYLWRFAPFIPIPVLAKTILKECSLIAWTSGKVKLVQLEQEASTH